MKRNMTSEAIKTIVPHYNIQSFPYWMALLNDDFANTPFGAVSVSTRINQADENFAAFSLLFNIADVVMCQPETITELYNASPEVLQKKFEDFQLYSTAIDDAKIRREHPEVVSLSKNQKLLRVKNFEKFKQLFASKKIIGMINVTPANPSGQQHFYNNPSVIFADILVKKEMLQAFLYGIDKNLFLIYKFQKGNNKAGLVDYIDKTAKRTLSEFILFNKFMAQNISLINERPDCYIDNNSMPEFRLLLNQYVSFIFSTSEKRHILESATFTHDTETKDENLIQFSLYFNKKYASYIYPDLLFKWRKEEYSVYSIEKQIRDHRLGLSRTLDALKLLTLPLAVFNKKRRNDTLETLWIYIKRPSLIYKICFLFFAFELLMVLFKSSGSQFTFQGLAGYLFRNNIVESSTSILWFAFAADRLLLTYFAAINILFVFYTLKLVYLKEKSVFFYRKPYINDSFDIKQYLNHKTENHILYYLKLKFMNHFNHPKDVHYNSMNWN